ncbi:hypothetical protein [Streptomyces sp. NPDC048442]|uniref:hypothetical protein n=1 Tax=Streptomyces sp. NPDC048442 TaxID=3154823 RepID=UPI003428CF4E
MDDEKPRRRPTQVMMRPDLDARTRARIHRYQNRGDLTGWDQLMGCGGMLLLALFFAVTLGDNFLAELLLNEDIPPGLDRAQQVLPLFGAALGALALTWGVGSALSRRAAREAADDPGNWVEAELEGELTEQAHALNGRVQQAITRIRASQVHQCDLIDRARNDLLLPEAAQDIKDALHAYSRLVREEPDAPQGGVVAELVARRRTTLDQGLQPVTRRIEALEAYAEQTAVADARYREFEQLQQLTDGHDRVLDFLARTTRDELAVTELEGITEEAATIAATLAQALHDAREQAAAALPPHPHA